MFGLGHQFFLLLLLFDDVLLAHDIDDLLQVLLGNLHLLVADDFQRLSKEACARVSRATANDLL